MSRTAQILNLNCLIRLDLYLLKRQEPYILSHGLCIPEKLNSCLPIISKILENKHSIHKFKNMDQILMPFIVDKLNVPLSSDFLMWKELYHHPIAQRKFLTEFFENACANNPTKCSFLCSTFHCIRLFQNFIIC